MSTPTTIRNPNDLQVGGTHYRSSIQHWDFVELNGLGYLEGCATKYVARAHKKHVSPREDLEKAAHYVQKLRDLYGRGLREPNRFKNRISVEDFCEANKLIPTESRVIQLLAYWCKDLDLELAHAIILRMIEKLPK